MVQVVIYTTKICPYCVKAKRLFASKNISYTEIDVENAVEREKMLAKSHGKRTVPQIFINDKHIGGCDDLYKLEQEKKLDAMLE